MKESWTVSASLKRTWKNLRVLNKSKEVLKESYMSLEQQTALRNLRSEFENATGETLPCLQFLKKWRIFLRRLKNSKFKFENRMGGIHRHSIE